MFIITKIKLCRFISSLHWPRQSPKLPLWIWRVLHEHRHCRPPIPRLHNAVRVLAMSIRVFLRLQMWCRPWKRVQNTFPSVILYWLRSWDRRSFREQTCLWLVWLSLPGAIRMRLVILWISWLESRRSKLARKLITLSIRRKCLFNSWIHSWEKKIKR